MNRNLVTRSEQPATLNRQSGKVGWALLWLLGIPLPVLLLLYLFGVGR